MHEVVFKVGIGQTIGRKETALHHLVMGQSAAAEGIMSFLEKRPPRLAVEGNRALVRQVAQVTSPK
ncbi:MAG: hypothetical protein VCA74_03465 [Deltaproteobacteria bacterium]